MKKQEIGYACMAVATVILLWLVLSQSTLFGFLAIAVILMYIGIFLVIGGFI